MVVKDGAAPSSHAYQAWVLAGGRHDRKWWGLLVTLQLPLLVFGLARVLQTRDENSPRAHDRVRTCVFQLGRMMPDCLGYMRMK